MTLRSIVILISFLCSSWLVLATFDYVETSRTYWVPWNTKHSQLWELNEAADSTISFFRRNAYFESVDTLILRDNNWNLLCEYIEQRYGASFIFPHLGFAVFEKTSNTLIGTIRFKPSPKAGYLSFGYGLIKEARHQKFGQELVEKIVTLIDSALGEPIITLKKEISKNKFMAEWKVEGNKKDQNLDKLIQFLSPHTTPFCGILGSVDMKNQGSLSVLMRNNMQPTKLQCSKNLLEDNTYLFAIDFSFMYPRSPEYTTPTIDTLLANLLSRESNLITQAENRIYAIFNIANEWKYLNLNRAQKQNLNLKAIIESKAFFSELDLIKKMSFDYHFPPYCLIQ